MSINQLTPREIYDACAGNQDPAEVIQESRADLATRLRVEEGFSQEEAYLAADQILAYAREVVRGRSSAPL